MSRDVIQTIVAIAVIAILAYQYKVSSQPTEAPQRRSNVEFKLNDLIESGVFTPKLDSNDPLLKQRKVYITYEINEHIATDVVNKLTYLDALSSDTINVYLSTSGGWGSCAFTIIETMRQLKSPVNITAVGMCYSAGTLILASATGKRRATENAMIMIHANIDSNKREFSHDYHYQRLYERTWKEQTELPEKWFPMTSDKAYYFNAEKAVELKVIDSILPVVNRGE